MLSIIPKRQTRRHRKTIHYYQILIMYLYNRATEIHLFRHKTHIILYDRERNIICTFSYLSYKFIN